MIVSLAVAMDENRVIGTENRLPWHIPEDLRRFKTLTTGHPVIMGRKTHESIGRLLPGRTNIILTRRKDFRVERALTAGSLDEALALAADSPGGDEAFVIGGGEIFSLAMHLAHRLHITEVHARIHGDAFFPEFSLDDFREISRERHTGNPGYSFVLWERRGRVPHRYSYA